MAERYGEYEIIQVFGEVGNSLSEEIASFWLTNRAIADQQEAKRRTAEVVCLARDSAGEIVAVNSVYAGNLAGPESPYYFFRMFTRPGDRSLGLAERMVVNAVDCLTERHAAGIKGIVLVTENEKLMTRGSRNKLAELGWTYVGRGPRGRDVWKIDFPASPSA